MNLKYSFRCVWSDEDGAFVASVPELPGCMADGPTAEEAVRALQTIIKEWIETAKRQKRPIPKPVSMEVHTEIEKKHQDNLKSALAFWLDMSRFGDAPGSVPKARKPGKPSARKKRDLQPLGSRI